MVGLIGLIAGTPALFLAAPLVWLYFLYTFLGGVVPGFLMALLCFGVSAGYFVYKLLNWDSFTLGTAPIVVGLFFIGSVQLFFIGVLGEYIGAVHTKVTKRPLVVERERLNF